MGERFFIREHLDQSVVEALYGGFPHLFSINLHHGGRFTKFPGRTYERSVVTYIDVIDVDTFSVHELDIMLEHLGYNREVPRYYHYLHPNGDLDFGLRALGSDEDVRGFSRHVSDHKLMHVYVELETTNIHTYFCSHAKLRIEEVTDKELREIERINEEKNRFLLGWHVSNNDKGKSGNEQDFEPFFGEQNVNDTLNRISSLEHSEDGYCAKHIHENMKQQFRGKVYKDAFWKVATSTTVVQFEKEMDKLKQLNNDAHLWLSKIKPEHWSRSHFSGRALSDVLVNNMCEVLNGKLLDARDKPIITMLEYIREYLMRRIVNVLNVMDSHHKFLTPYATKIFDDIKKEAARYTVEWNGEEHYQVSGPYGDQCVVNMTTKSCACRSWEITGIPCKHAVAAIWVMRKNNKNVPIPEAFLNPLYRTERWKQVYRYKVFPINGMSMWPKSQVPTVIKAPSHHKPIGRPKKARKKSAVEHEEARSGAGSQASKHTKTCGKCNQKGHNKRTCTAKP